MISFDLTDFQNLSGLYIDQLTRVDNIYFGSKICTIEQVQFINSLDIKTVIDLKQASETDFDDKSAFQTVKINYVSFPISNFDEVNYDDLKKLKSVFEIMKGPYLIYCMTSNRVGALMALYLCYICGHPKKRAFDFGKRIGMKKERLVEEIKNQLFDRDITNFEALDEFTL